MTTKRALTQWTRTPARSKRRRIRRRKRTPRADAAVVGTARAGAANITAICADEAGPPTAARKINANTAKTPARTRASMTRANASTTRSTKVGEPAKCVRSWVSRSNANKSSCQT